MRTLAALLLLVVSTNAASAQSSGLACGMDPRDWGPSPPGDVCGRHTNAAACMADKACYGVRYRGESAIACIVDARGFPSNCPTVGCTSTPPK